MICAETDAAAEDQLEDMEWFWNRWSIPYGLPMPKLLVGSPDTIADRIEVLEGLAAGDRIVTAGVHQLVEGQTVRLYESTRQAQ